jgi:uncharacterized membrane protein HdeD (DUF308 family)
MNAGTAGRDDRLFVAESFRSHWLLFILVGGLLIVAGGVAIVVPAISSIAPNEALGLVLLFVGIVQIVQSGKMRRETPFAWHLTLGFLAAIGGVLVYLDPFPGIVTITVLIAIVLTVHGATQIAFAAKVRRVTGWRGFVTSGCIALIMAGLLVMKLPYSHSFTPATLGGVSLLSAGWAYIAIAGASRRPSVTTG